MEARFTAWRCPPTATCWPAAVRMERCGCGRPLRLRVNGGRWPHCRATLGVRGVALSAGGELLASGSFDGTVKLWDTRSGDCLRTLRADRCYERLDITGLTGITEGQRAALLGLGAVQREG